MSFSSRMQDTASNLIIKYGTRIQLVKPADTPLYEAGTHRPYWLVDGVKTYTEPNSTTYDGYATLHKPKSYEILDGRIRATDTVFSCVQIPEPNTHDKIQWMSELYNIIYVEPTVVQSDKILYKVFARAQ